MSEPVNLNKFRKAKKKADAGKTAAENRVKFGRTKAEKALDRKSAEESAKTVDGAKLDD